MRVGTNAFFQHLTQTVNSYESALGGLTVKMSSGNRIQYASEDPLGSQIINRAHTMISSSEARQRTLEQGVRLCQQADVALDGIADWLQESSELAASATQSIGATGAVRQTAAASIRSCRDAMLQASNSMSGDRYLLAGFQDRTEPFTEVAGVVQYNGDSGQLTAPLGSGRTVPIAISGDKVLNFDGSVAGVSNAFQVLDDLANAIETGDIATARNLTEDVDALFSHVTTLRGSLGTFQVRLEANISALEDTKLNCNEVLADEESLDIAEAITEYSAKETAYSAVLSVMSRIMSMPSLFDLTQ